MKLQTLLGKQATDADIEEIKAEFHPSNTANVNIVPYEIYDEDGEEIVVGEVRKTIDGVKKRKPRYRKTIYIPSGLTSINTWQPLIRLGTTHDILEVKAVIHWNFEIPLDRSTDVGFDCNYNMNASASDYKEKGTASFWITSSDMLNTPITATVEYIKSTDTWTTV